MGRSRSCPIEGALLQLAVARTVDLCLFLVLVKMADDSETSDWYSPAKCAKGALTGEDYVTPKAAKRPRTIEDSQESVMAALDSNKDGNGVELR